MAVFKWCFIGAGKLAYRVAKEITGSGRHEIVSVYTRRPEKGKEFAKEFGCAAYADVEAAITAEGVQAVYVVTPHDSHYKYVKQALKLGRPVLCEKAFTTDAKQAEELFALARSKGIYVAEAMWTWFSPVAGQVKQWMEDGECGEIQKIVTHYHLNVHKNAPRLTDPELAGGALLDSGVYPITYLYRLFGNPIKVSCQGIIENGVDLEEEVDLTFASGKTYHTSISIRDFKGFEKFFVSGTKGNILVWRFHSAKRAKLKRKDGKKTIFTGDTSLLNEFDIVAREILAGRTESAYVPHQATLDVMRIMDECRRQMGLVYPFERE